MWSQVIVRLCGEAKGSIQREAPGASAGSKAWIGPTDSLTGAWMSRMMPRSNATPTTSESTLFVTLWVMSTRRGSPHSATR